MGYREVLGGKDGIGGPNQANLKMEFCNKTVYRTVTVEEKVDQMSEVKGNVMNLLLGVPSLFLRNYRCVSRKITCTVSRIMRGGNLTPWCTG